MVGKSGVSASFIQVDRVEVQKTDNTQTGVIIGFDCDCVAGDPDNYPLAVAKTLTNGYEYPTGYIFETLRGEGLIYDANSFEMPGRDHKHPGTFIFYAGCDAKNANRVVESILENVARLQGTPQDLNPHWFERAEKLIVTSDALAHETPAAQAETAAVDELYGLGYAWHDQFAQRVQAVKLSDISPLARRLLSRCVITINTDKPDAVSIKSGVRTYNSFKPIDLTPRGVQHDSGASH